MSRTATASSVAASPYTDSFSASVSITRGNAIPERESAYMNATVRGKVASISAPLACARWSSSCHRAAYAPSASPAPTVAETVTSRTNSLPSPRSASRATTATNPNWAGSASRIAASPTSSAASRPAAPYTPMTLPATPRTAAYSSVREAYTRWVVPATWAARIRSRWARRRASFSPT